MKEKSLYKRLILRSIRLITGNKGCWCSKGVGNHVSEGTILYEPCNIGNYNYFAPYSLVYNAVIGNYCSIGPGCRIGLAEHDLHAISTKANICNGVEQMKLFDYDNPAIVGNDVWIGANVVVKQGVKIGDGAVIGANAVITKDIPPYAIAVGIPAKVLSYRFDKKIRDMLIKSKWWDLDFKEAKKEVNRLYSIIVNA